ncbi:MRN complex-interacting protein-like [Anoplopoma fimbria]|uniref:MRN complex-interacting protein-like n=1 Tax=Anoplopoma fimbria TaxID=229290 RepID=UPI0023ECC89B|nr:MRN complex-interacting protein-like [Anoplopoma fimbria]
MVQEFNVLRCFSCQSFQVQQVKKVTRWSCKLCGEKQSLLKEFGRGSGADCRRHVQKLNAMRGAMMEEQEHNTWSLWKQVEADREDVPEKQDQLRQTGSSRWSKYLDTPEEAEPEEEDEEDVLMDFFTQQLHDNSMIDRKRMKRWTDGGGADSWTPEQTNSLMMKPVKKTSLNHTSPPSENHTRTRSLNLTSPPSENHTRTRSLNHTRSLNLSPPSENHTRTRSLNHTSPPSENHTRTRSLNHTSPPSENHTSPPRKKSLYSPSVSSGPVSRWACFLPSDCHEGAGPSISGRGQSVGGAVSLSCDDISQAPPLTRSIHPVSSMFESGEDFSFEDF